MLVVGLVKEAQQQGLGLVQIMLLVPYVLPEAMRFAVPGTMLFATASVFGRMSASNEITALKAAGVTPMSAMWPAFGLALVVSFVSVWLNDVAVSWGRDGIRRVVVESVEQIIYGKLRQQRSYSTPQVSINVKGVEGRTLIRPTLSFSSGPAGAPATVSAAEAELRANAGIDQIEQVAAGKQAMGIVTGRLEHTIPAAVAHERALIDWETTRLNRIVMEPWRRWANGFSCLCFVLVGAPMAIRMRNADFLTSFFLCFLPILIVYYPVFILGVDQAKAGKVPPIAVWAGNLLMVLWGWWLMRRVVRQ